MGANLRVCVATVLCVALTTAGCASKSTRAAKDSRGQTRSEEARAIPRDPSRAFLEGYRAYRGQDFDFAADCLSFAAEHYPELADYALFYAGLSQKARGRDVEAEAAMRRLVAAYPQSILAERAELAIGEIELKAGRAGEASEIAARIVRQTTDSSAEQDARLLLARAPTASNDPRGAYEQLQALRNKYPRGEGDPSARELERSLLAAHPGIVDVETLEYHRDEAELLLTEGVSSDALAHVDTALRMLPPPKIEAELLWLEARAARSNPARARRALAQYLAVAPDGPAAPLVLDKLARIYWNQDDTGRARVFFRRLVRDFPSSRLAPEAMLAIGRTFEDDGELQKARAAYDRLSARHPASEAAVDAHFRAAFTLYMDGDYGSAARRFRMMAKVASGADRDMFSYWRARALEAMGESERARAIFQDVALSIDSNYYPALASRRIKTARVVLPAALLSEPDFDVPLVTGDAGFHLSRVLALRALNLKELEPGELKVLEIEARNIAGLRRFVLARYRDAGAWSAAVEAATEMARRGEIDKDVAERFRFPRAYWDLIAPAAERERLDPYLLLSIARQESLFNPMARSSSDARGLMQLLPVTANRLASAAVADNLYDPAVSVALGSSYLRQLLDMFHGDDVKAIAAYNGGESAVRSWSTKFPGDDDQWVENIGYRETRDYVKKVIGGVREYQLLYRSQRGGSISQAESSPG